MENTENTSVVTEEQGAIAEAPTAKTFTEEEVMKLIQSEADKRVTAALSTQKKKYEKELSLSKLDGAEREKAEKDNRIAELEEKLAAFQIEKNKSELKSVLSSRGLSAEFADIVAVTDNLEESQANIDKLDKLFKAAVKAEVEKRLIGNSPKGNTQSSAVMTKAEFDKLTIAEQSKLLSQNPDFYNQFLN